MTEQPAKHTKSNIVLIQPPYHGIHQPDRSRTKLLRQSSATVPPATLMHSAATKTIQTECPHHFTSPDFLKRHLNTGCFRWILPSEMPQNLTIDPTALSNHPHNTIQRCTLQIREKENKFDTYITPQHTTMEEDQKSGIRSRSIRSAPHEPRRWKINCKIRNKPRYQARLRIAGGRRLTKPRASPADWRLTDLFLGSASCSASKVSSGPLMELCTSSSLASISSHCSTAALLSLPSTNDDDDDDDPPAGQERCRPQRTKPELPLSPRLPASDTIDIAPLLPLCPTRPHPLSPPLPLPSHATKGSKRLTRARTGRVVVWVGDDCHCLPPRAAGSLASDLCRVAEEFVGLQRLWILAAVACGPQVSCRLAAKKKACFLEREMGLWPFDLVRTQTGGSDRPVRPAWSAAVEFCQLLRRLQRGLWLVLEGLKQPPVASPVVFRSFSNCTVKSQFKHGEILVSVGPL